MGDKFSHPDIHDDDLNPGIYTRRAVKILNRVNELGDISEDKTGITRTFGTPAFIYGCQLVMAWMIEAGLETRMDNIGNVRGRYACNVPGAKTLVIASHIDTVINAGKFDGPLGVIMGIDAIENLADQDLKPPFNIELVAFSDEEGVRFHTTFLGSSVVAGSFNEELLNLRDNEDITLKEVILGMGGNTALIKEDAIRKEDWLGYFEIHIEQGPVLFENNISVGIVTAIAGQQRAEITFKGVAGHAGTVPMDMRSDALCAAAAFIIELEKYAFNNQDKMVATVGKLQVHAAASNVIPGVVVCSVDIRSADDKVLATAHQHIKRLCSEICTKRKIGFEWKPVQGTSSVKCDPKLVMMLKQAVMEGGIEAVELVSGAGHDAVPISQVAPVCMLFVRCFKGISHNPMEDVELKDIAAAAEITDNFMLRLMSDW